MILVYKGSAPLQYNKSGLKVRFDPGVPTFIHDSLMDHVDKHGQWIYPELHGPDFVEYDGRNGGTKATILVLIYDGPVADVLAAITTLKRIRQMYPTCDQVVCITEKWWPLLPPYAKGVLKYKNTGANRPYREFKLFRKAHAYMFSGPQRIQIQGLEKLYAMMAGQIYGDSDPFIDPHTVAQPGDPGTVIKDTEKGVSYQVEGNTKVTRYLPQAIASWDWHHGSRDKLVILEGEPGRNWPELADYLAAKYPGAIRIPANTTDYSSPFSNLSQAAHVVACGDSSHLPMALHMGLPVWAFLPANGTPTAIANYYKYPQFEFVFINKTMSLDTVYAKLQPRLKVKGESYDGRRSATENVTRPAQSEGNRSQPGRAVEPADGAIDSDGRPEHLEHDTSGQRDNSNRRRWKRTHEIRDEVGGEGGEGSVPDIR